ncbi:MAG: PRC-barrel domain-containing protein [Solirubrobacterales bacterium]
MITGELRGGNRPSLDQALGWIGSRVDDIYGASVGRLEDVWIDPATGVPKWLLIKEGRFGGRTTLIPFEDATAGAGHVWIPYERELVRDAPEIEPGTPLTQQLESDLRSHFGRSRSKPPASQPQREDQQQHQQDQQRSRASPPDQPIPGSVAGMFTGERPGGQVRTSAPTPVATSASQHPVEGAGVRLPPPPQHAQRPPTPPPVAQQYAPHPSPSDPSTHRQAPNPSAHRYDAGYGTTPHGVDRDRRQGGYRSPEDSEGVWSPSPQAGPGPAYRQAPSHASAPQYAQPPQAQHSTGGPDSDRSDARGGDRGLPAFDGLDGTYEIELDFDEMTIRGRLRDLRLRRLDS